MHPDVLLTLLHGKIPPADVGAVTLHQFFSDLPTIALVLYDTLYIRPLGFLLKPPDIRYYPYFPSLKPPVSLLQL